MTAMDSLTEREKTALEHFQKAQELGSTLTEYCAAFGVERNALYPLHGKKVALFRRTGRHGNQVVHLELKRKYSRELPAWMIDASIYGAMTVGSPQVSASALNELRAVIS